MQNEIVVAVVDMGIPHASLPSWIRQNLYWNHRETPGNGRDDDGNGFVDDVTGPSTGPASNGYYQPQEGGGHGLAMVKNVATQIEAAKALLDGPLPVSIMPVSMTNGGYYANILAAAKAGASVISLSHNTSYAQKAFISRLLEPYDVIAVTVDRDTPASPNPDAGGSAGRAFDNVIEVALVSDAITRGNVHCDLLEVGASINDRSESHAIANVAGKIAAIWAADPSRGAKEVLEIVEATTTRDHPTIQAKGLQSEMGGRIDLARGLALARGPEGDLGIELVKEVQAAPPRQRIDAEGYTRGTDGDDEFHFGSARAIVASSLGDDVFVIAERPEREHVIRGFDAGDALDLAGLLGEGALDRVRLQEVSWNGETHMRAQIETEDGSWASVALLQGVSGLGLDDALL
jgi:hypothetical protein